MVSSGQSCISVQRVFADRVIAEELANRMVAATRLTVGDPYTPAPGGHDLRRNRARRQAADRRVCAAAWCLRR